MDRIEVKVLDAPTKLQAPFLARLTQRGHELTSMDKLEELWNKGATDKLIQRLYGMQHGTIKRNDMYTVAIVGASRRFLAQIRTHQHANFVSGSLQYSDWKDNDDADLRDIFVVPYELLDDDTSRLSYLLTCKESFEGYKHVSKLVNNDIAGYTVANAIRNVLIIQANAQEWQYIIGLRTCRRNSTETRYVTLRVWEELIKTENGSLVFSPEHTGTGCQINVCAEGPTFSCRQPYGAMSPSIILNQEFPKLVRA